MNINPAMRLGGEEWRKSRNRTKVKVIGGIPQYIGRIGEVLQEDEGGSFRHDLTIRVVFDNFWSRPDGIPINDVDDNTWLFKGEYEVLK